MSSPPGWRPTEEHKARLLASLIGRPVSDETRARMVRSAKARGISPETRAKMSHARQGVPGRLWSSEQRTEQSVRLKGKSLSPEHRAKLSAAHTGRRLSPEHVAVRAAAQTGLKRSTLTCARHSEALARNTRSGRVFRSALEVRAGILLMPHGFQSQLISRQAHHFDFGRRDAVVEVQGCYWHGHQRLDPTCRHTPRRDLDLTSDVRIRRIAAEARFSLLELWECQESTWPGAITGFLDDATGELLLHDPEPEA